MEARYQSLIQSLENAIPPEQIIDDPLMRFALGTDASFYRLTPKLVIQVADRQEIKAVINACRRLEIPYTFRAAGTSLSGQAVSDSVLITLTSDWCRYRVDNEGKQILLEPGVIGADANRYLAPYQRKIGPDPASINTCKIGGIAANNASGMCCGTAQNSYHTIAGMSVILADGAELDTLDPKSVAEFKLSHASLLDDIATLASRCRQNFSLAERIRHKYRLKNTTGYSLNALIDFDDPIDILQHLMIGSEGTLGFIADITYHTVPDHPHKATGLYLFNDINVTCNAVIALASVQVAAVELMDSRALRSVAGKPGMPDFITDLDGEPAALLVEVHGRSQTALIKKIEDVEALIRDFLPIHEVMLTRDTVIAQGLWGVRKGLFPAVGAVRETGTTVIIEDVAFPIEKLAEAVLALQACFEQYGYDEAIIFGHALAGNLHFVFTQSFESEMEVQRYADFMDAVSELVAVKFEGSLKAEHGTGRNMAPYVELEWGAEGLALMREIKAIFDPAGIVNPGVIINDNPDAHVSDLKSMPAADPIIDTCIECGFCEPVCPSRHFTLTPRQRNAVYREIKSLETKGQDDAVLSYWRAQYQHAAIDSCVATGLCADRCPVDINTGELMKALRADHTPMANRIASWSASQFGVLTSTARAGLKAASALHGVIGTPAMQRCNRIGEVLGLPEWHPNMPTDAAKSISPKPIKVNSVKRKKVVYFPSCAARTMGPQANAVDRRSLTDVTTSLLAKAGYEVIIPDQLSGLCCGMPYSSKGFDAISDAKSDQLEAALWRASEQGTWPILMDTSPCSWQSHSRFDTRMDVMEPFTFIADYLLSELLITPQQEPIMLHVTCTSRRRGLAETMLHVAQRCASQVVIPEGIDCCGFAGDKGFTMPELNASALHRLAEQVPNDCREGYSNSRTCEIGLSKHSGIEYRSILYLLDKVSDAPFQ